MEGPPQSQPPVSEQVAWTLYILYWLFSSLLFTFYLPCLCSFDCIFFFSSCFSACPLLFVFLASQWLSLPADFSFGFSMRRFVCFTPGIPLFCLRLFASWFPLCFTCLSTVGPLTHCRLVMFRIHMLVHCIFREINRCLNFSINECYELNKDYQNKTFECFFCIINGFSSQCTANTCFYIRQC